MAGNLYISNLSHSVDTVKLEHLFAGYGKVRSAEVINELKTADITGTGLIEMDCEEHCEAAIAALNGKQHRGSALVVGWARPGQPQGLDFPRMFGPMNIPAEGEGDGKLFFTAPALRHSQRFET